MTDTFEEAITKSIFSPSSERTLVDKLLSKQDIDRIKELTRKSDLTREELLELMYMCLSAESKLYNFNDWDRYIMNKFFVWIRDFVKAAEELYDAIEDLKKSGHKPTERTTKLYNTTRRYMEHSVKFLIDIYLNLGRTSLSVGATGFMELLKNKFEVNYGTKPELTTPTEEKQSFKLFSFGKK